MKNSWGSSWGEEGYIRMERNIKSTTGKCGIAMEASYPIKKGANPPNPGPSPPSPVKPPSVCDNYYSCPESTTCCCIYEYGKYCFAWGCCPLEGATCCDDHYSCCPHDYPVCDTEDGLCLMVSLYVYIFSAIMIYASNASLVALRAYLQFNGLYQPGTIMCILYAGISQLFGTKLMSFYIRVSEAEVIFIFL